MGEQAAKLLNGKGTVAFITSLGANNLRGGSTARRTCSRSTRASRSSRRSTSKEDSVRCAEIIASATNRYPDLGAWISVGGWPVFTRNALTPVPPTTKVISFDTNPPAPDLLKAGKVQVLLGQKYFGWGSETVQMLYDIVHGKRPADRRSSTRASTS